MRILRVAQTLYPDVKGGGAYHVHAMSRDQASMGHDVTVVTVRTDPTLPTHEETNGYTVYRFDPTIELLGNTISNGIIQFIRSAGSFDIVHAHSHLYFSTNVAAFKRVLSDTPLAITNHGLYSQNAPEWLFDGYLHTIGRWTFNRADIVFCYTEGDKKRVSRFGVDTDIEVISNGIDQRRFTPEGPRTALVETDNPVVLFVGRLVEGKRPQDAVEAVAELKNEIPDVELYFCGKGPLRESLAQTSRELGIEDSVTFLGQVPYNEMPNVYRSADVLLLTSRAEGLPRTVLEAFASGTPAVTSALEQIVPIVQEAGFTVPIGDIEEFEAALAKILMNPALQREFGDSGRRLITEKFTWDNTVSATTSVFEKLV